MASDRCRRAGGRAARRDRRQYPARQAQAELHPACRLRRPCRHRQCGEGAVHRQEDDRQDLLPPHRLSRRDQADQPGQDPRGPLPRARARKGDRADDPARASGPRPDARAPPLCRHRASARRPEPRSSRCRGDEPQEQGGCNDVRQSSIAFRSRQADPGRARGRSRAAPRPPRPKPTSRRNRRSSGAAEPAEAPEAPPAEAVPPRPRPRASVPAATAAAAAATATRRPTITASPPRARRSRRSCASSSSTSRAAPTPPAAARTRSPASG